MSAIVINPLVTNIEYSDGQVLTTAQLDAAIDDGTITSVGGYVNTMVVENMIQGFTDCFGAAYVFTNNGVPARVNTLFEKQNQQVLWTGGDINIATVTDSGWVSVDAVNAAITFTPEVAGHYKINAVFTHIGTGISGDQFQLETLFRFTDGSNASPVARSGGLFAAPSAANGKFCHPVHLTAVFNWTTTLPVTILLQKQVVAATNGQAQVVAGTVSTGQILLNIEKI